MSDPLVSICIPTYNSAETIREMVESVLAQSYRNLQILIADNASTDDTLEIARSLMDRDPRIEVIRHDKNIGGEANFRWCLSTARGDYVAIFHSDDVYSPDMVANQVRVLSEEADVGVVFTGAHIIDECSKVRGRYFIPRVVFGRYGGRLNFNQALHLTIQYGNLFICPSAMARQEIWSKVVPFQSELFRTSADLGTWLSMLRTGCAARIIDAPLMSYRASINSYTYNFVRQRRGPHDILLVLDHCMREFEAHLSTWDRQNYQFYYFKEAVNRAINAVIQGEPKEANLLIRQHLSRDVCAAATHSIVQAKFLAIGVVTLFLSMLPLGKSGRKLLAWARFG